MLRASDLWRTDQSGPAVTNIFKLLNSILNSNHWGSLSWDFPQFTVTNHFEEGLSWGLKFTLNSVVWVARIKTRYFADFLRSVFYVHVIKVVVCVLFWLNMAENDIESLISAAKRKRGGQLVLWGTNYPYRGGFQVWG